MRHSCAQLHSYRMCLAFQHSSDDRRKRRRWPDTVKRKPASCRVVWRWPAQMCANVRKSVQRLKPPRKCTCLSIICSELSSLFRFLSPICGSIHLLWEWMHRSDCAGRLCFGMILVQNEKNEWYALPENNIPPYRIRTRNGLFFFSLQFVCIVKPNAIELEYMIQVVVFCTVYTRPNKHETIS